MTEANKKMATIGSTIAASEASTDFKAKPKLELKWKRVLRELMSGSLNRFDAEKHGDHCLHTTVAGMQRDHLVVVSSRWEEITCMGGLATSRVKRYWVARDHENMTHARNLLDESVRPLAI